MVQLASLRPHRLMQPARGGPCWRPWRDSLTDRGWDRKRLGQSDEAPDSRPLLCRLGEVGPAWCAQAPSGQARPESRTFDFHRPTPMELRARTARAVGAGSTSDRVFNLEGSGGCEAVTGYGRPPNRVMSSG